MATAPKVTYPHIVKAPGVRGGKAHIKGTRICVADLVWLGRAGKTPEEMREYYSDRPLTLAEVHAALAYYYDHPDGASSRKRLPSFGGAAFTLHRSSGWKSRPGKHRSAG